MKSNKNRPTRFYVSLIVLISLVFVFQKAKAFEYKPGYNLSPILKSGNEIFNRLNTKFVPASDIQPFVSRPAGISGGNLIKIGQAIVVAGQTAAKTANYLADKLSLSLENKNSSYAAATAEQAQNIAVTPPVSIDQEKIIGIFNEVIGGVRSFFGQELISIPEKKEIGPQGSLTSPQPLSPPLRILTEEQIKNLKDIGAKAAATAGQAATAAEQAAKAVFEAIKPKSEMEITAEKISSVPAIDIAEEQEKLKEEVIAAKEKATNLFNQSFIEEPGRVSVWPISPAVAREQRRKAAEDIRNFFNNLGEFFTKEEIVAQPEERTLIDEGTINLLAAKISAKLPQVQQVLKETQTVRETQTKETQILIDEKKVQAVAGALEQLKQKQAQDRQDLFNAISLTGRINNISNVTITNPTFSSGAITDADIPDTITASNYLALSGGTLTGNFLANTASSTITNLTVVNATSTNATTTMLYVSGNIGIGTTSPSEQFSVANRIYVGGSGTSTIENNLQVRGQLKVGTSSTYISGTEINATENFTIRTLSDNNHLVLQSLGRVGVSSSTPWGVLSVERNGANGNMPIFVVAEQGTSSPYFIINDLGRVGLGTTTPGSLFSIQGNALFSGNLSVANLIATGTTRFNGITYTWPSTGGSANQALLTDGAGTLSWGQGGEVANWNKQSNFGVLTLTPTTTIPIWIKDAIYASSTLTVNGPANFNSISATSTLNITGVTTLTNASTTGMLTIGNGFISSASSTVAGPLQIAGSLQASSTVSLGETAMANATTTSLAVTGNASTSQLIVSNSATLNTVTGNGLFTLNSGLLSTASSTFSSNLSVSGVLNASSTLLVADLSTLTGGFISQASSTVIGNFIVSGGLNASSTLTVAGNSIFYSNVGIGTTSPGALLAVQGDALIAGTTTVRALVATSSSLTVGGSNFVVDASGNVGIGTAGPTAKMQVVTSGTDDSGISTFDNRHFTVGLAGNSGATVLAYNSASSYGALYAAIPNSAWKNIAISPYGGNTSIGGVNALNKLNIFGNTIIGSGYTAVTAPADGLLVQGGIGIATTSPGALLAVQGNALFSGNLNVANITATGTLNVTGVATFTNASTTGMLTIGNGFISQASSTVIGNFIVSGGLNASSTLTVAGASRFYSTFQADDLSTLAGGILANNASSTITNLSIINATSTNATTTSLAVTGNASTSQLIVSNSATLNTVTGNGLFTLNSGLLSTASSTISSQLTVSGPLSASSTLLVANLSTLTGGFISSASSTVASTLHISGNLQASSTVSLATTTITANHASGSPAIPLTLFNTQSATNTANRLAFQISGATSTLTTSAITSQLVQNYDPGKGILAFSVLNSGLLSEAARFDSNGFLGIGTTSPGALLAVQGDALIAGTTTVRALIATSSSFSVGGSNFVVDGSGKVKIGTGAAGTAQLLDIYSSGTSALRVVDGTYAFTLTSNGGNGTTPRIMLGGPTTPAAYLELGAWDSQNNWDNKGRTMRFYGNGITGMYMLATSGNVGIATATPGALLAVQGTGLFTGTLTAPNIIATGTLNVTGDTTLTNASTTGMLTIGNGFISSASSTIMGNLSITGALRGSSTATSTMQNGINLVTGCFSINGTCVGGGGGSSNWTDAGAYLTPATLSDGIIISASSTVSGNFIVTGGLNASSTLTVAGNSIFSGTISVTGTSGTSTIGSLTISPSGKIGIGTTTPNLANFEVATRTIAFNSGADGDLGLWATSANTFADREYHSSVTANGYVYVLGGLDSGLAINNTAQYAKLNSDGTVGVLATSPNTFVARLEHSSVTANGYVYVLGGLDSGLLKTNTAQYAKLNSDGTVGAWTTGTNYFAARADHSSVTANGYVYVLGGRDGSGKVTNTAQYAKLNSDGTVGAWATSTNSFAARYFLSSVTANGYVYVLGGVDGSGARTNTVQYAKLNSDGSVGSWATSTNTFSARAEHSSVAANGYVYVLGGLDGSGAKTNTVQYAKLNSDGTVGAWTTGPNTFAARYRHSSVTANGYVYVLGGMDSSDAVTNTAQYASTARILVSGNLDLLGLANTTLGDVNSSDFGSVGGSIFAGNIFSAGQLEVTGNANFWNGVGINGVLSLRASTSLAQDVPIFSIQNATGTSPIMTALYNGNVGIGTTSPGALLAVQGDALFTGALSVTGTSGTSTIGSLTISPSGKIGIGTTTPNLANFEVATRTIAFNSGADGDLGSWATSTNAFAARNQHSSVTANGYVYVLGGQDGTAITTNTVQYAKLNSDGTVGSWATSTNTFAARRLHSSVTANGYVYVLGGVDGAGAIINTILYAKLNSDGTVGSWATSTNSFAARYGHSSFAANGYVYVLGGVDGSSAKTNTAQYAKLNSDGTVGAWATSTNTFAARYLHSSVTANGYVYVLGGQDGSSAKTNTAQYAKLNSDGTVGSWATSTNTFAIRYVHSSVTANGYVYVLGGQDDTNAKTNTAQYAKLNSDGTVGAWATSTNAFAARNQHSSVTANGYVYVLGGLDGSGPRTNTAQYASTARILVSGNLDLLGLANTTLGDVNSSDFGSVGGSIFAGNIFSAGQLEVTGNANFWNGVGINGTLSLRASTSLAQDVPIFSIQNATGTSPIMTALYNGNVGIGTSSPSSALSINGTCIDTGAGCADYAELYSSSEPVESGDIVGLDTANPGQVKKSKSGEIEPIGAVSSNPAIIIEGSALQLMTGSNYKNNPDKPAIALAGKIPVKVNLEGGEIKVNDPITISSIPGVGKKAVQSGKIVGYALENYGNSTSTESYEIGPHKILVFASSGYWLGLDILDATSTNSSLALSQSNGLLAQVVDTVKAWLESMKVFIEDGLVRLKNLVAEKITTQTLCVEDVCVDKAGLQALLLNAGINSLSATSTTPTSEGVGAPTGSVGAAADTEPPIITLIGESAITIEKGISWVDPGATVTDNVNDNLGIYYKVDGVETGNGGRDLPQTAIDTNVAASHTITYTSTDQAGNIGTATRTVNVIDPAPAVSDTPTVSDTATTTTTATNP